MCAAPVASEPELVAWPTPASPGSDPVAAPPPTANPVSPDSALTCWLRAQAVNVNRHAAALRPFKSGEFGTGLAAPSEGHLQAVNQLLTQLRQALLRHTQQVTQLVAQAVQAPSTANLQKVVWYKDHTHAWVRATEKIWDFYFELFGQRQSRYAEWLLGCDRIGLDCYQVAYLGVGVAKPIPAPPPFAYMRTGFSPATYRRGIPLRRLGQSLNPFPLIQLPYHRLVNPWTLGAVLHEISHNLQTDLGLNQAVPRRMAYTLLQAGLGPKVALIWARWNRELFADVCAVLLGGPGVVPSLMDVLGRSPQTTMAFNPNGPHPTPFLRTLINVELLRRLGFAAEAEAYRRLWLKVYPNPRASNFPPALLETFEQANRLVVNAVCFQPFAALGQKSLAQVIAFGPKEQVIVEEAAQRLASGTDPGIVPARFLVGAARAALDKGLAAPETIKTNFYRELARR